VGTRFRFWGPPRRASLVTLLFGFALLAAGLTGCGNETAVTAAEQEEPHSHPHVHDLAGEPAGHVDEHGDGCQGELPSPACPLVRSAFQGGTTAERRLYQTPGGRYTAADIAINGGPLPWRRFRYIESHHDMHPQPGDRLCPVTGTRASPRFTWIVGGKAYQFCCPPCIDEFVRQAKQHPRTIRPPEQYVKH
jgi:hypothetical protein